MDWGQTRGGHILQRMPTTPWAKKRLQVRQVGPAAEMPESQSARGAQFGPLPTLFRHSRFRAQLRPER